MTDHAEQEGPGDRQHRLWAATDLVSQAVAILQQLEPTDLYLEAAWLLEDLRIVLEGSAPAAGTLPENAARLRRLQS